MHKLIFIPLILCFITLKAESNNIYKYNEMISQARAHVYDNPAIGIKYTNKALSIAKNLNDSSKIFTATILLGGIYSMSGNYDLALESYLDAENYLDIDDLNDQADYYINMASMYYMLNDSQKSYKLIDDALAMYKLQKDTMGMAWVYNLKGLVYLKDSLYMSANNALDSALIYHSLINNIEGKYSIINNKALVPGDEIRKIEQLNEAILYSKKMGQKWTLAENYNTMGFMYINIKEYDKALKYLNDARKLAIELDAKVTLRDNYQYMSDLALNKKDYKLAYESLNKLKSINNDINNIDKIRKIEEDAYARKHLNNLYKLEIKDNALKLVNQQKMYLLIFSFLIISILILIIRVYYINRVYKLKSKAEEERSKKLEIKQELENKEIILENKNEMLNVSKKELTDLVYLIKSKDKLLENILLMLQETQKKAITDPKAKNKSIIALIKNFKDKEIKSNLFVNEISKNENEFLERLKNVHPDLSKNEIVLVTLLRVGLSSKEIALLIDSNQKTINMARYRMRKKLNLETDDNLIEYLEHL